MTASLSGHGARIVAAPAVLHWAIVLLFTLLSCGIFGWMTFHPGQLGEEDRQELAMRPVYLVCALVGMLLIVPLGIVNAVANNGQPRLGTSAAVLLLELMVVFLYSAFFSMAASLRQMPKHGVRMHIGGITLFFFTALYLQGQLG